MDRLTYHASGRNGQWWIDEYRNDETGTTGNSILCPTRKLAREVAAQLNTAFSRGVSYGTYLQADRCKALRGDDPNRADTSPEYRDWISGH